MNKLKKPFLGVAYYPEDWDECHVDHDLSEMKRAGISSVRIAEFAWSLMEPTPGHFDFEWLHRVVDRVAAEGLQVIMCTPTATPPIWLSRMHPDIFTVNADGHRAQHGARRNCCCYNPHYLAACRTITEQIGREFGHHEAVIGWQIDNELDFQHCHCDYCQAAFRRYLQDKYGSIAELNRRWNLNLFSQTYSCFEEIVIPDGGWHNPHIKLEYLLFQSRTQSDFLAEQIATLRPFVTAPIGTDAKPYSRIDHEDIAAPADIVQFNHYDRPEDLPNQRFWFDMMRALKDRPFWNTETSTCWAGGVENFYSLKPYGFCRINSWMPVALGGEAAMYWLWRTHRAGHEIMHGAVLHADGRPFHIFGEVQQVSEDFRRCSDFITGTRVVSECAYHSTSLAWNMMEVQPILPGQKYFPTQLKVAYEPLVNSGVRCDVIGTTHSLDGYRMLVTPFCLSIEQGDLQQRICEFVKSGGVWVVGPMTDIRDGVGARYFDSPYGIVEQLTGAHRLYEIPDNEGHYISCAYSDGTPCVTEDWYEVFEDDGDGIVHITDGYPSCQGKPVVLRKQVGRGIVYIVGTILAPEDMQRIYAMACRDAGITRYECTGDLIIAPRRGEAGEGLIVAECKSRTGSITLPEPMTDILTGTEYSGKVELTPYRLLVLKKN